MFEKNTYLYDNSNIKRGENNVKTCFRNILKY